MKPFLRLAFVPSTKTQGNSFLLRERKKKTNKKLTAYRTLSQCGFESSRST